MSWLKRLFGGLEKTRPWDTRFERPNHHCGSQECSKPDGCLCLCEKCRAQWAREDSAARKMFEAHGGEYKLDQEVMIDSRGVHGWFFAHGGEYKLAREVENSPRPFQALLARREQEALNPTACIGWKFWACLLP